MPLKAKGKERKANANDGFKERATTAVRWQTQRESAPSWAKKEGKGKANKMSLAS
jgi:hypothetical protein